MKSSDEIKAGDLVKVDYRSPSWKDRDYIGIAIGSNEAFIGETVIASALLKKITKLSSKQKKLQTELKNQYMELLKKNIKYDFSNMQAGDRFVRHNFEFIYLGFFQNMHVYMALEIIAVEDDADFALYSKLHKRILKGELTDRPLYRVLQSTSCPLYVSEDENTNLYYIGHSDIEVGERCKSNLKDCNYEPWFNFWKAVYREW